MEPAARVDAVQGLAPSLPEPARQRLLLAGGGHSHALLLRMWAMRPRLRPVATEITLVSRSGASLYSGLVPGLVAGIYERPQCAIDLRRLCSDAGVRFVQAEIEGLDAATRRLRLRGRPPLMYELLSLDVGAVTDRGLAKADGSDPVQVGEEAAPMAVKPLEPFLAWCERLEPGRSLRLRGGGAAAVELALALRRRGIDCVLLLRGDGLHLGSTAANRAGERLLRRAGVLIEPHVPPQASADLLCTGSRAPAWLAAAGLPVDAASGRVLSGADLMVCGHSDLFVSGDCGLIRSDPRPPSGVWAVRAAPVLAENLRRRLLDPRTPLRRWRPQRWALQLLADGSTAGPVPPGGGTPAFAALALWGPFARGPSTILGRWKDRIDRRFMRSLGTAAAEPEARKAPAAATPAMACRGCAAKLAAAPLAAALARLDPGGAAPAAEDAVPLGRSDSGALLLQSVDGFPALVEDPWLNARLTTLHACSDLWACGARVTSVQALVTVPQAAPDLQEELLVQSLSGVRSVLDPLGARLIGGHTLEARDGAGHSLALTVQGPVLLADPWSKGPLRAGDALLLSRPLGSGVLLAAAMAGAADPADVDGLLAGLQASQAPLVELLAAHGCHACTDVTGFGLLGHLGEMVALSSDLRVHLDPAEIPAWPGALALLRRGFASTLAPANARALALLEGPIRLVESNGRAWGEPDPGSLAAARRELLLDPQTCGPLLAALPAERALAALEALRAAGFHQAAVIATVA
jgi:selenide,water dikinase